jgi:hypothetical protein
VEVPEELSVIGLSPEEVLVEIRSADEATVDPSGEETDAPPSR